MVTILCRVWGCREKRFHTPAITSTHMAGMKWPRSKTRNPAPELERIAATKVHTKTIRRRTLARRGTAVRPPSESITMPNYDEKKQPFHATQTGGTHLARPKIGWCDIGAFQGFVAIHRFTVSVHLLSPSQDVLLAGVSFTPSYHMCVPTLDPRQFVDMTPNYLCRFGVITFWCGCDEKRWHWRSVFCKVMPAITHVNLNASRAGEWDCLWAH